MLSRLNALAVWVLCDISKNITTAKKRNWQYQILTKKWPMPKINWITLVVHQYWQIVDLHNIELGCCSGPAASPKLMYPNRWIYGKYIKKQLRNHSQWNFPKYFPIHIQTNTLPSHISMYRTAIECVLDARQLHTFRHTK